MDPTPPYGRVAAYRQHTMPDLDGVFRKSVLTLVLSHAFTAGGPGTRTFRALHLGFVRCVDKALEDYQLARTALTTWTERPENSVLSPLMRAIGHMENCLTATQRALRFARPLLEQGVLQAAAAPAALSDDARKRIKAVRDASEHMDERILDGRVPDGGLNTLWMAESYLELDSVRIGYDELATWLQELQRLAQIVAAYRESRDA